ncbi:MAG: CRISPR-associated protein Csx11 [Ardenticatenaceae bacterium]|nr:CRISPR-associated protein Csx11 [Ardenticatenaceae bacterium]
MSQLDLLAQHRNEILLAEAIGWLHDYRKCSDEILRGGGSPRPDLLKNVPALSGFSLSVSALALTETIEELLHESKNKASDPTASQLLQYLSRCHNTAHFDKQEPVGGVPNYPIVQISSSFGFEKDLPDDLTSKLWNLPWNKLAGYSDVDRKDLGEAISDLFSQTIADTRRPINEVDLWSWGLLVGALYKSALAGALLTGSTYAARDLRWRLLGIRVNGLDYLLKVARIPDLLARQELLSDSLNRVRGLIEITYPLGSEVYRDENGSVYVVPDISDLLKRTDSSGTSLQTLILQAFEQGTLKNKPNLQLGGEIMPHLELEQTSWWGQDPGWPNSANDELPEISRFLLQKIVSPAKADKIKQFWQNGEARDVCTVCGLRPQGPGQKAADRNVCDICEQRRADRSQKWATSQPDKTIWTDEVADVNGRLALIVGQFDLAHWLDGSLVESLLLIAPHDPENTTGKPITSKTPSFSRLRRIWETTRCFWQEVQAAILQQLTDDRRRLKIHLDSMPDLGPFHVYDLELGATDLSVVWVPPEGGNDGYLISADNLGYIARQLGAEVAVYRHPATAAIFVEDYLGKQYVKNGRQPILRNSDARAGQGNANLLAGICITQVEYQENQYAVVIPILAEPRTFMVIVPADKSLSILRGIKDKYECEMGKVRDRLPMHLGIVYASRRTPIRAVLDAGRAMLDCQVLPQQWTVKAVSRQTQANAAHFSDVMLFELERKDHRVTWQVPLRMGDGVTEDRWYPYFFLETGGDDGKADAPNRRAAKITRPAGHNGTEDCWIVHATDLRADEAIYVWPSAFDFEFLDTTARRFEIHYDENGRRPRRTRPFYLEDLDRLETLWSYMKRLSKTQRHQVIRTIEATREAWYGQDNDGESTTDEILRQFVADTLAGAEWPQGQPWSRVPQEWQEKLVVAGARGELADLAELHLKILKE